MKMGTKPILGHRLFRTLVPPPGRGRRAGCKPSGARRGQSSAYSHAFPSSYAASGASAIPAATQAPAPARAPRHRPAQPRSAWTHPQAAGWGGAVEFYKVGYPLATFHYPTVREVTVLY